MKIIFDFDYTLFDTEKFKLNLQKAFEDLGVDEKLFLETYNSSKREQVYEPKIHFELIKHLRPEISIERMEKTLKELLKGSFEFLYSDTLPFLEKWQDKTDLILLSFGKEWFQREKIKNSGIESFFRKIFVTKDTHKVSLLRKVLEADEMATFVDDNPQALFEIKKAFQKLITVRMKRREGKYKDEPDNPQIDFSIKNLKELEKLMFVTR